MIARRYKILGVVLAVLVVGAAAGALVLSHTSPCGADDPAPAGEAHMKAVVQHCYGTAADLRLEEITVPVPAENQVRVKVRAASLNAADWHHMTGTPYVARLEMGIGAPSSTSVGTDFAGVVEAVGSSVTRFKPGDEVFGARDGALGEYVIVGEQRIILPKPPNLTFEQSAAIPVAAITALQGLRDHGRLEPGQKVLINGASGGVGTFAVQIAKALGAEVTGVCSTRNADLVRSLGADHVIDYTQQNFTEGTERYDLVFDNVGNHSLRDTLRVLKPEGVLVIVTGPKDDPWIGPLSRVAKAALLDPFVDQEMLFFIASFNIPDLEFIAELVRTGKVTPAIDRTYPLNEFAAAMTYMGEGHARAKIIVTVE